MYSITVSITAWGRTALAHKHSDYIDDQAQVPQVVWIQWRRRFCILDVRELQNAKGLSPII